VCKLVVGNSAPGSAALARNVTDALRESVPAVLSGCGLAGIAAEVMGSFFWFGAAHSLRHSFEWLALGAPSWMTLEAGHGHSRLSIH
jgi:hypothetical protein